ncbi:hypothetical protein [Aeromicrobium terrae]|uniref:Uncharacterized protein n=1 Tax=Aeromicrobium terrae TaxID=2498846 RepID=A0A5C8NLX5_9ACTN|nr:hypothetical protein [Aeromicrobium terrae]TXL62090.1 hypothetical protein FHP06_05100 [Aeromicrobium terrae]
MRWDRLFADLEGQADDLELAERDVLVDELRDGTWAETSWRELVGGRTVLEVIGLGRVEGDVQLVNDHVVHLDSGTVEHVVAASAVLSIVSSEHRALDESVVTSRLGWGHVFRAARAEDSTLRITRADGTAVDGRVDVVGHDFVRVASDGGRTRMVPFAAVAAVTLSGR